jgi:hypothetical protein
MSMGVPQGPLTRYARITVLSAELLMKVARATAKPKTAPARGEAPRPSNLWGGFSPEWGAKLGFPGSRNDLGLPALISSGPNAKVGERRMFLSIISWRVGFPASSAKAGSFPWVAHTSRSGSRPCSKRAGLIAFSASTRDGAGNSAFSSFVHISVPDGCL